MQQLIIDYWTKDSCRLDRINAAMESTPAFNWWQWVDQGLLFAELVDGKLVNTKATKQAKANARILVNKLINGTPLVKQTKPVFWYEGPKKKTSLDCDVLIKPVRARKKASIRANHANVFKGQAMAPAKAQAVMAECKRGLEVIPSLPLLGLRDCQSLRTLSMLAKTATDLSQRAEHQADFNSRVNAIIRTVYAGDNKSIIASLSNQLFARLEKTTYAQGYSITKAMDSQEVAKVKEQLETQAMAAELRVKMGLPRVFGSSKASKSGGVSMKTEKARRQVASETNGSRIGTDVRKEVNKGYESTQQHYKG